jgi:MAC/Perforin domain
VPVLERNKILAALKQPLPTPPERSAPRHAVQELQPGGGIVTELIDDLKTLKLDQFAKNLEENGYQEWSEFGSSPDEVRAALTGPRDKPFGKPGEIARALAFWEKNRRGGRPVGTDDKPEDCELAKGLGDGLREIAVILVNRKGFKEFKDLGDTDSKEEDVRTRVRAAVGDQYPRPGDIARVVQAWKAWNAGQNRAGKGEEPEDCELTKALGSGLKEIAVILVNRKGFRELKDLGGQGSKEEDVRARVATAVGAQYLKQGEIARVVEIWKAAQKKTGTLLDLPKLPDKTSLDLTQTSIKIDNVDYKIPSEFAATKTDGKFKTANDLTQIEWIAVAKRTGLLFAFDMKKGFSAITSTDDVLASQSAFLWQPKEGRDFLRPLTRNGDTKTQVSYTSSSRNLVHSKVDKGALDVATPYLSASLEVSEKEKIAKTELSKTQYSSGRYRVLYGILSLKDCIALKPQFVEKVKSAVLKPTDAEKANALEAIFDEYGYLVPMTVVLGGELYFTSESTTTGAVDEKTTESSVRAAVKAKYEAIGAGVAFEKQEGEVDHKEFQQIMTNAESYCSGGDGTLSGNPKDWAGTTKDPNTWAVIGREGLEPLANYLDEVDKTLRPQVEAPWKARLKSFWGGHEPPKGRYKPDLDGLPFLIRNSLGPQARGLRPVAYPPNSLVRTAPSSELGEAIANGLAWELQYTALVHDGEPVYFIVEHQTAELAEEREAQRAALQGQLGGAAEPLKRVRLAAKSVNDQFGVYCEEADLGQRGSDLPVKKNPAAWRLERKPGGQYRLRNHVRPDLVIGMQTLQPVPCMKAESKDDGWYLQTVSK